MGVREQKSLNTTRNPMGFHELSPVLQEVDSSAVKAAKAS
jgi:hypothetical protein